MKKEKKTKVKGQGEVSLSLYEINQNLISQFPAYDEEKLADLQNRINEWKNEINSYFMILCNDIHYYTILHRADENISEFPSLGHAALGLLLESGYTIHSDEQCDDHFEIWVKQNENTYDFLLFPYDSGVVTYG